MPDLPSFQDLFRVARDEALANNTLLTRDVIERAGTDANALIAADASVGDELVGQLTRINAAQFLDSATRDALTRLVFDRYNIARKPAAAALGTVLFRTTAPTLTAFNIPANTRLQTASGRQYSVTEPVVFPSASSGPVSANIRSVQAGLSQQAQANTITSIVDAPPGSPSDLRVTNLLATAGADDEENDETLVKRAREFFSNARRGTTTAIANAALAFPGVRTATAFEAIGSSGYPARYVQLIISDAFTQSLVSTVPTPPAYTAQSQALAAAVGVSLDESRAAGIYVQVVVALVVLQAVQLSLTFAAGYSSSVSATRARATIVGYINGLAPGQTFNRLDAATLLQSIPGIILSRNAANQITGAEIASPPGNVQPTILQVLRTSMSLVAVVNV